MNNRFNILAPVKSEDDQKTDAKTDTKTDANTDAKTDTKTEADLPPRRTNMFKQKNTNPRFDFAQEGGEKRENFQEEQELNTDKNSRFHFSPDDQEQSDDRDGNNRGYGNDRGRNDRDSNDRGYSNDRGRDDRGYSNDRGRNDRYNNNDRGYDDNDNKNSFRRERPSRDGNHRVSFFEKRKYNKEQQYRKKEQEEPKNYDYDAEDFPSL
jgi:hypothetical protein